MKMIKTITKMMDIAKRRGYASLKRFGNDVYYISYDKHYVRLYHYGTLTLKFSIMENRIVSYYGESASDRDSMNTALYALGYEEEFFRFSRVREEVYLTTK